MLLTLDGLKEMGAFTGAPVERQVTWQQGGEDLSATVFVRPLSYHSAVSDIASRGGAVDAVAGRIASCIVDAEGRPVFTVADITGEADPERGPLSRELSLALLGAIGEVSGLGKSKPAS